jgi:thymidylate synthase
MRQYHDLLEDILERGEDVKNRTGIDTRSLFGYQMRFNLSEGFPAITTKRLAWRSVVGELLWMLEGSTDERRLAELTYGKPRTDLIGKTTIWTSNADNQGVQLAYTNNDTTKELGPIYGSSWRDFGGFFDSEPGTDQIEYIIEQIKMAPNSRRILLSAWNPTLLSEMALPPCHFAVQFRVCGDKLSCMMTQRSGDFFLGVPFNIASYSLLTHIIARECSLEVGDFIHSIGDAHVYNDHFDQVSEQLSRKEYPLPTLMIDESFDLMDRLKNGFRLNDVDLFTLDGYQYHPTIKAPMAT